MFINRFFTITYKFISGQFHKKNMLEFQCSRAILKIMSCKGAKKRNIVRLKRKKVDRTDKKNLTITYK